jgi:hypothetical protein
VLGSSLHARAEINYALAHSRWLALEGARGQSIQIICEETARVARRLGFISMRVQVGKDESVWKMADCASMDTCGTRGYVAWDGSRSQSGGETCRSYVFRHQLPGQASCFIELQTPNLKSGASQQCQARQHGSGHQISASKYKIVSEVLAEGWAKSIAEWQRRNQEPIELTKLGVRGGGPPDFSFAAKNSAA